jgi:hypothetical protein
MSRLIGAVVALPLLLVPRAHPTPKVVLAKQVDVIRQTLPGATQFFVRDVTIGKKDLDVIQSKVDWNPQDPDMKFYLGKDARSELQGVVFFPQVNTVHGPLEVGMTMAPDGSIADVAVTVATVETKPWVEEAMRTGLLQRFKGMRTGDQVAGALDGMKDQLGAMQYFEAEVIATAVHHGLVLYNVLFAGNQS